MVEIENTTVIVPTHERKEYLLRSISFFSKVNVNVIYVDSSKEKLEIDSFPLNIQYYHLPGLKFHQKALYALDKVNSKFVSFCADDDFLILSTIRKAEDFLVGHSVASVVGRYLAFDEGKIDFYKTPEPDEFSEVSRLDAENVKNYMSQYHQILWAVYRKEVIKQAYQMIEQADFFNDNFIELSIATVMSAKGGIKVLNEAIGVREITAADHWGKRHKSIGLSYKDKDEAILLDIKRFIDVAGSYIPSELAELSINTYLKSSVKQKRGPISKLIFHFTSLLKRKESKKYVILDDDLTLIKKVLVEYKGN